MRFLRSRALIGLLSRLPSTRVSYFPLISWCAWCPWNDAAYAPTEPCKSYIFCDVENRFHFMPPNNTQCAPPTDSANAIAFTCGYTHIYRSSFGRKHIITSDRWLFLCALNAFRSFYGILCRETSTCVSCTRTIPVSQCISRRPNGIG